MRGLIHRDTRDLESLRAHHKNTHMQTITVLLAWSSEIQLSRPAQTRQTHSSKLHRPPSVSAAELSKPAVHHHNKRATITKLCAPERHVAKQATSINVYDCLSPCVVDRLLEPSANHAECASVTDVSNRYYT